MVDQPEAPFITLAQLVKLLELAPTGGQSKAFVRDGGIIVNGEPENRPGRKLRQGDIISVGDQEFEVDLEVEDEEEAASEEEDADEGVDEDGDDDGDDDDDDDEDEDDGK